MGARYCRVPRPHPIRTRTVMPDAPTPPPPSPVLPLLVRAPDEARTLEIAGVRIRFLVSGEETGGAWSLLEYTAPAGFAGPAPHLHRRTTEMFYVLDGVLTLESGGSARELSAGSLAVVAPGTPHRFANPAAEPCRFLVQVLPGGMEGYFVELAELIRAAPRWPPADPGPVAALAERFDTFPPPH